MLILGKLTSILPGLFGIVLVLFIFAYYFSWVIVGVVFFAGLVYPSNGLVTDIDHPVLRYFFRSSIDDKKQDEEAGVYQTVADEQGQEPIIDEQIVDQPVEDSQESETSQEESEDPSTPEDKTE